MGLCNFPVIFLRSSVAIPNLTYSWQQFYLLAMERQTAKAGLNGRGFA